MKKKILKKVLIIFIISFMSIAFKNCYSYGEHITGLNLEYPLVYDWENVQEDTNVEDLDDNLLSVLQTYFGYSGEELETNMKLVTTITITKRNGWR